MSRDDFVEYLFRHFDAFPKAEAMRIQMNAQVRIQKMLDYMDSDCLTLEIRILGNRLYQKVMADVDDNLSLQQCLIPGQIIENGDRPTMQKEIVFNKFLSSPLFLTFTAFSGMFGISGSISFCTHKIHMRFIDMVRLNRYTI